MGRPDTAGVSGDAGVAVVVTCSGLMVMVVLMTMMIEVMAMMIEVMAMMIEVMAHLMMFTLFAPRTKPGWAASFNERLLGKRLRADTGRPLPPIPRRRQSGRS